MDDEKSIDKRSKMDSDELSDKSCNVKTADGENEEQQNVEMDEKIKIDSEEVGSKNIEIRDDVKCKVNYFAVKNYSTVEFIVLNFVNNFRII